VDWSRPKKIWILYIYNNNWHIDSLKKKIIFVIGVLILAAGAILFLKPKNRNLRGSYLPSNDQKTYLAIDDDNEGACKPLLVDGKEWSHTTGESAPVTSGEHRIQCG
jgi:hypothetical protein